jgi:outer membrane protein assembly factor BamB
MVAAATGSVLAEVSAPFSPSASATLVGDTLIVPEGRQVAAYEASTLALRWRRPTPEMMWADVTSAQGRCLLRVLDEEMEGFRGARLWDLNTNEVQALPPRLSRIRRPACSGSTLVYPSGGGAAERLTAMNRETLELLWEAEFPPPAAGPFWTPPIVERPVHAHGECLVAVTDLPSVECRRFTTGERLWTVGLEGQPYALRILDGNAWVASEGAQLTVVEVATGLIQVVEFSDLISEAVEAIVRADGSRDVLMVGWQGSICGWSKH